VPKLAKHVGGEPRKIQRGIQIAVQNESTNQALVGTMFERHALFDVPTARTPFGGRKPARGDEHVFSDGGDPGLEELQELPHCRISHRSRQFAIGHHSHSKAFRYAPLRSTGVVP